MTVPLTICANKLDQMIDKDLKAILTMVKPRSNLPFFRRSYLPDNIRVTAFVSLKTFFEHREEVGQVFCVSFDP